MICIIFSLSATEDAGETGDSVYLEAQAKAEPAESVVMTTTTRGCCKTV
jgi:hypothetical protein